MLFFLNLYKILHSYDLNYDLFHIFFLIIFNESNFQNSQKHKNTYLLLLDNFFLDNLIYLIYILYQNNNYLFYKLFLSLIKSLLNFNISKFLNDHMNIFYYYFKYFTY